VRAAGLDQLLVARRQLGQPGQLGDGRQQFSCTAWAAAMCMAVGKQSLELCERLT
jgi:hypothetical protein